MSLNQGTEAALRLGSQEILEARDVCAPLARGNMNEFLRGCPSRVSAIVTGSFCLTVA